MCQIVSRDRESSLHALSMLDTDLQWWSLLSSLHSSNDYPQSVCLHQSSRPTAEFVILLYTGPAKFVQHIFIWMSVNEANVLILKSNESFKTITDTQVKAGKKFHKETKVLKPTS